ncbi:MAG TPA: IS5 family transposase [Dokdonella sp.]|nr:IS5 family transposase [Dokdonella sp.]
MKQTTFASIAWNAKGKTTRRERFLSEMDQVIPWSRLLALIEPHYPKGSGGRPVMPLERMLRIYFMQQWFNLSDPGMEDALYDSESMRRFAGVELVEDAIPDETTILNFRHLLERHGLMQAIFAEVRSLLEERGLLLKQGTIVDATIINAPSSTKNASGQRDPEMRQARKGKQWHFGMKLHVGTDPQGVVHTLVGTPANVADIKQTQQLLHGAERVLYGDQAYWSKAQRQHALAAGIDYQVNERHINRKHPLSTQQRLANRERSRVRARGEHAFRIVKQLWGFSKVRYRGLTKNIARAHVAFALSNLYLMRGRLLEERCAQ